MPTPVSLIAMLATFRQKDQDKITKLMDLKDPVVYAGSLVWCDILFRTITSRNPDNTIRKMKDKNLNEDHNKQVMIYSNSASSAEGILLDTATAQFAQCYQ